MTCWFRWKDYRHGSQVRLTTLTAEEFLRRFYLHVLPKGFVRIRFYGSWRRAVAPTPAALAPGARRDSIGAGASNCGSRSARPWNDRGRAPRFSTRAQLQQS